jgi:uncharacterized protein (TIGR00369 family)
MKEHGVDPLESARTFFSAAPFIVDLGIVPTVMADGTCETGMVLQHRHQQHTGQAHAGVVTALADHTAGAAAQSLLTDGAIAITAELKISLLRPARGERLECNAVVIKAGRALVFVEAEVHAVTGAERALVAKLSATMAVVTPR